MREWFRKRLGAVAVLLGLIAFGVYLKTLAPTITFGDGPELTTAAYQLGVADHRTCSVHSILGPHFNERTQLRRFA